MRVYTRYLTVTFCVLMGSFVAVRVLGTDPEPQSAAIGAATSEVPGAALGQKDSRLHEGIVRISIDAGQKPRAVALRQGFLHGVTAGNTSARTLALIDELRPKVWRLSNMYGVHEFVRRHKFASTYGTCIVYNVQDVFSSIHGNPVIVSAGGGGGAAGFGSFEELRRVWTAFIESFMQEAKVMGWGVDYYDLFSEPEWSWKGITQEQFLDLLRIAHDGIRRHEPFAKIVAPSVGHYSDFGPDGPRALCEFLAANHLRVDALAWHEYDTPERLVENVASARAVICAAFVSAPEMAIPEIHINEYSPPQNHLIPGWTVAWLDALERAEVDVANRACWDITSSWSACANGLNGLFMADNERPQPLFFVHRAYAQMPATRLAVTRSDPSVVVLASRDDAAKEIRVLVGRFSGGKNGKWIASAGRPVEDDGEPPVDIKLSIKGVPTEWTTARASMERIPNASLPTHLVAPLAEGEAECVVKDGRLDLTLNGFQDGDAWTVVVRGCSLR